MSGNKIEGDMLYEVKHNLIEFEMFEFVIKLGD